MNLLSQISNCLSESSVFFLKAQSRDEAIAEIIDQLDAKTPLEKKDEFYQAVLEREKVASTGIGMGFAIPHARLAHYDQFFMAIGLLDQGVHWDSMDRIPVKMVFLIGGPDDKQSEYLSLLSELTLYLRDEETRKKLLTLTSPNQIIELFAS